MHYTKREKFSEHAQREVVGLGLSGLAHRPWFKLDRILGDRFYFLIMLQNISGAGRGPKHGVHCRRGDLYHGAGPRPGTAEPAHWCRSAEGGRVSNEVAATGPLSAGLGSLPACADSLSEANPSTSRAHEALIGRPHRECRRGLRYPARDGSAGPASGGSCT